MSAHRAESAPRAERTVVWHAVARFAVRSLVAMFLVAIAVVFVSQQIARDVALDDARFRSGLITEELSGLVGQDLRDGEPAARAEVDAALRPALLGGSLSHVKLWAADGSIIWSNDASLVDRRFRLEPDVVSLFGTRGVTAEVSDLSKEENARERRHGELLEVYVGSFDRDGRPWVFEAYVSTETMQHTRDAIVAGMLPLALGAVLLLQVAILPLAVSLARRVQRAQVERSTLLRHALLASELERRRLAQDLHDGVIQDLAGLSLALPAVADHLPDGEEAAGARRAVSRVTAVLERDVPALRSLLTDIYPPDLDGGGLVPAVQDLVVRAEDAGLRVEVRAEDRLDAPPEARRLAYRVVREGLRNAVQHAPGAAVEVHLLTRADQVVVRVVDDGPGLSPGHQPREGHLGLRLLEDTVRDLGGGLDLSNGAAGGVILEAHFPVDLDGG